MKPSTLKSLLPIVIFIGVTIAVVIALRQGFEQSRKPLLDDSHPKVVAGTLPAVTLYSTDWCTYCEAARTYLTRKQIPFVENDIEKDVMANQKYQQLGGNGIPFITIDESRMQGFDRKGFKAAYLNAVNQ